MRGRPIANFCVWSNPANSSTRPCTGFVVSLILNFQIGLLTQQWSCVNATVDCRVFSLCLGAMPTRWQMSFKLELRKSSFVVGFVHCQDGVRSNNGF